MKRMLFVLVTVALAAIPVLAQKSTIQGVWRVAEVTTTGTDGSTNKAPQPSLYIFTKKHYSIIFVASDSPRAVLSDVDKATADELRTVFVESFVANAGTYELKAGKVTVRPMVAKSPSYMQPGTYSTSSVKIAGNTMTMIGESSNSGAATNPTTMKLVRVE